MSHLDTLPTDYKGFEQLVDDLDNAVKASPDLQHCKEHIQQETQKFRRSITEEKYNALTDAERVAAGKTLRIIWGDVVLRDERYKRATENAILRNLKELETYIYGCAGHNNFHLHRPLAGPSNLLSLRQQHNYGQTHARTGRAYA